METVTKEEYSWKLRCLQSAQDGLLLGDTDIYRISTTVW